MPNNQYQMCNGEPRNIECRNQIPNSASEFVLETASEFVLKTTSEFALKTIPNSIL